MKVIEKNVILCECKALFNYDEKDCVELLDFKSNNILFVKQVVCPECGEKICVFKRFYWSEERLWRDGRGCNDFFLEEERIMPLLKFFYYGKTDYERIFVFSTLLKNFKEKQIVNFLKTYGMSFSHKVIDSITK